MQRKLQESGNGFQILQINFVINSYHIKYLYHNNMAAGLWTSRRTLRSRKQNYKLAYKTVEVSYDFFCIACVIYSAETQ